MPPPRLRARRRLLAAPLQPFEAYAGKVLARIALACGQALVLLGCGALIFRLPLGDQPLFLLPFVLSLAAVAGLLSILAGLFCRTEKQVILLAIFGAMILSALGGCWWPIELVPETFKMLAMVIPSYWAMHGLQSVLYFGKSYQVIVVDCAVLLGFSLLLALVVRWTLRPSIRNAAKPG